MSTLTKKKQLDSPLQRGLLWKIWDDFQKHKAIYVMLIPVVLYYIVFEYGPIAGIVIAFKDYKPAIGIWESSWSSHNGFGNFVKFFDSYYFWSYLRNTFKVSFASIIFGFPAPIILALLLNEVKNNRFKKFVQTVTYMPHFISIVVICGIILDMVSTEGVITNLLVMMGFMENRTNLLQNASNFIPTYVISDIWQHIGWGTIIYLSAFASISTDLYEAAEIDGATRWKQVLNVTLPSITLTIVTMFILRIGSVMSVGWEKVYLLSNPIIADKAEVISSLVYKLGMESGQYSYAAAIGLFNSLISLTLLVTANNISRKLNETSLW